MYSFFQDGYGTNKGFSICDLCFAFELLYVGKKFLIGLHFVLIFTFLKLFTMPQEKSWKKNLGLLCALLLQLPHWRHGVIASQGEGVGGYYFVH